MSAWMGIGALIVLSAVVARVIFPMLIDLLRSRFQKIGRFNQLHPSPTPFVSGRFRKANVATQLVPLMQPHVAPDAKLMIVGSYGDYSARVAAQAGIQNIDEERWLKALREWLSLGAEINYLLVAATDDGRDCLNRLSEQFTNFHLWEITAEDVTDPIDKAYVKELRTYHPVLLEDKKRKRRAMWLENHHEPGSTEADNCDWIAPKDAASDPRFDEIQSLLRQLIAYAADKKQLAAH